MNRDQRSKAPIANTVNATDANGASRAERHKGKFQIGVIGGTGYGGSELLRLLARHPHCEIAAIGSSSKAGAKVAASHPYLRGFTPHTFSSNDAVLGMDLDALFLAMPHGQAAKMARGQIAARRIIDLSGDFRLRDVQSYERWYGLPHPAAELLPQYIYGLSEWYSARITEARYIANPGCFATAILLGLLPLAAAGLIAGQVIVDAKTGSSGSGASPTAATHHPSRSHSLYAYKPFSHQHEPEIVQCLAEFSTASTPIDLIMQAHSVPLVRGILASIYVPLAAGLSLDQLREIFAQRYHDRPFVRVLENDLPNVAWTQGANYADIGLAVRGRTAAIFVTIDNLVKGAAGQAIQNLNLMLGLPESTGLDFPGIFP